MFLNSKNNTLPSTPAIYAIINSVSFNYYIGQSVNVRRRFIEHKTKNGRGCKLLHRALLKYGLDKFYFTIIATCEVSELNQLEVFYIKKFAPDYNISFGGKGAKGHTLSPKVKNIISAKSKENWNNKSETDRYNIISKNLTGPAKGHVVLDSTRQKLRMASTGKKQSEDTIQKRATALKTSLVGNTNGNRPVLQFSVSGQQLKEYPSSKKAADALFIHPSNITKVLSGHQKTAAGYLWKLKDN
jgi:group I intron endonuclease